MPLMNVVAVVLGLVAVRFLVPNLARFASKRPFVVAVVAFTLMTATLFDAGLDGVHRWLKLGPIRLHWGAIVTPILLLAIIVAGYRRKTLPVILMVVLGLALYALQPDAGQSTSLAAGVITFVAIQDKQFTTRFVLFVCAVMGASIAWLRPDPLHGLPMVEDIVAAAFAMHLGLGIGAVLTLGLLPVSALWLVFQSAQSRLRRLYGFTLAAYFLTSILVVFFGEFPTPVLGFGMSPILGAMLGLGLLAQMEDPIVQTAQSV
jgi:hypothetical protein